MNNDPLAEARRILATDPPILMSTPEWRQVVAGLVDIIEEPWRLMDSAPRDGAEVILQVERRAGMPGRALVGHYMPGGHCIEDHPPIDEGWYFWNGCMFDKASRPLRWKPLPTMAA